MITSRRATNEKIQLKRNPHGAQSDKDTLRTGKKGSSYEEARTNGPMKCDRGLNGTTPPPPPHPKPEGWGQTLPLGGRGGMGGAQANPTTPVVKRGVGGCARGEGRNGRGTSKPYYPRSEKGGGWVC